MVAKGEQETLTTVTGWRRQVADYLGLERSVGAASAAVLLLGLGEELWKKFLPKYMEALGAGPGVIGLFGTAEDFFDKTNSFEEKGSNGSNGRSRSPAR